MPVRPMSAKATEVVHAVDIISDYAEQIDWGFVSHLMETGAYSQLPDRIRPKQDLPPQIEFSLAIVPAPHDPSKHVILKLYTFMEGGKNVKKPVATARALCDGIPYMIDCPSARTATICFKYMWQMMGGDAGAPVAARAEGLADREGAPAKLLCHTYGRKDKRWFLVYPKSA